MAQAPKNPNYGDTHMFFVSRFGKQGLTTDKKKRTISLIDSGMDHCMASFPLGTDAPWSALKGKHVVAHYVQRDFGGTWKTDEKTGELLFDEKGQLIPETVGSEGGRWEFLYTREEEKTRKSEDRARLEEEIGDTPEMIKARLLSQYASGVVLGKQAQRHVATEDLEASA
jgi:hypothetical protein